MLHLRTKCLISVSQVEHARYAFLLLSVPQISEAQMAKVFDNLYEKALLVCRPPGVASKRSRLITLCRQPSTDAFAVSLQSRANRCSMDTDPLKSRRA